MVDIQEIFNTLKHEIAIEKTNRKADRYNKIHNSTSFTLNIIHHVKNGNTKIERIELEGYENMFLIANYWYKHNQGIKRITVYVNDNKFYTASFGTNNIWKTVETKYKSINIR